MIIMMLVSLHVENKRGSHNLERHRMDDGRQDGPWGLMRMFVARMSIPLPVCEQVERLTEVLSAIRF